MTKMSGTFLNSGACDAGPQGEGKESPSNTGRLHAAGRDKYQPYPDYKDSGTEWFGNIPNDWCIVKIGHLTTKIGSGKTPSGGATTYVDDGITFLRSQNIYDDGLRLDDVVYISHDVDAEMAYSRVKPMDILINT